MSGTLQQLIDAIRNLLTWWVTVAPWEQAIRVRLGKDVELLTAGFHLRIPIADRIYRQSVRTRALILPPQTLTTTDGKSLTIAVSMGYRIVDLLRLYQTLHHAEATLQSLVLGAVARFVACRTAEECRLADLNMALDGASMHDHGIEGVRITATSFAFVKTYRLITGEGHTYSYGDTLETSSEMNAPGGVPR